MAGGFELESGRKGSWKGRRGWRRALSTRLRHEAFTPENEGDREGLETEVK